MSDDHFIEEYEISLQHNQLSQPPYFDIPIFSIRELLNATSFGDYEISRKIGEELKLNGLIMLKDHGIDFSSLEEKIIDFFTSIPFQEKQKFDSKREGSINQGYFYHSAHQAPFKYMNDIPTSGEFLQEGWVFCEKAFNLDGQTMVEDLWPQEKWELTFRYFTEKMSSLILPITQSILHYLNCDPHLYDEKLQPAHWAVRINHYPIHQGDVDGLDRMLSHTDTDLMTFIPNPSVEGLQFLHPTLDKWFSVRSIPNTIILNTGDYMKLVSNNIIPSVWHKVAHIVEQEKKARASFPMAVYLWEDDMVEVLPCVGVPKHKSKKAINFHTQLTSRFYGKDYAVLEAPEN